MNNILDHADAEISAETQQRLNAPPLNPNGFKPGEKEFIQLIVQMLENGKIDLMRPASLINQEVYKNSSELAQGKADFTATNFCSKLRNLKDLVEKSGGDLLHVEPSYQVQALVADLKYRKEQFETQYGDLFVI